MNQRKQNRPSARDQQKQARGLVVAACVLVVALFASVGGVCAAVLGSQPAAVEQASGGQASAQGDAADVAEAANVVTVQEPAATEPEQSGDAQEQEQAEQEEQAEQDAQDENADQADQTDQTDQVQTATGDRAADLALDPSRNYGWSYQTNGEKIVYLTFDDGPSYNTAKILDILDQYNAKATFFVTGHGAEYRSSIKDAYERGHSIGLHSYTHDYASVYASVDAYFADLEQVGQIVEEQIGFVPYLVRFPGGASNTVSANYCSGIMTALSEQVQARGYQYYDWNISSGDAAGTNVAADSIVSASCQEGWTNIMLLFHDSNTKDTTVEALPQILEFYSERGYVFRAIDRTSFVCHHAINN